MDYASLHEQETVIFKISGRRKAKELARILRKLGAKLYYDVYSFPRTEVFQEWESDHLASVEVILEGKELDDPRNGDWNELKIHYLLATLPVACIPLYTELVLKLSQELELPFLFDGQEISLESLEAQLNAYAEEVATKHFKPGSLDMKILIQSTYPRN